MVSEYQKRSHEETLNRDDPFLGHQIRVWKNEYLRNGFLKYYDFSGIHP